jgi:hypothetical protein
MSGIYEFLVSPHARERRLEMNDSNKSSMQTIFMRTPFGKTIFTPSSNRLRLEKQGYTYLENPKLAEIDENGHVIPFSGEIAHPEIDP